MDDTAPPEDPMDAAPDPTPESPYTLVEPSTPGGIRRRFDIVKVLLAAAVVLLVAVLTLQVIQLRSSYQTNDEVAALTEDVTDLKPLRRDVDVLGDQVAALGDEVSAVVAASAGASPAGVAAAAADGSLPAFEDSANDPAVLGEMTLVSISGPEYYGGADVTVDPSDGTSRVWMVWAHWCPYCQAELPLLEEWYPDNAARFPDVEFVTVTTAIDETRGNPLEPYLDSEQFPFPVIVDNTGEIAGKFGTTAFPFWVVTDGTGTVLLRVAGAMDITNVDQIFSQLESMADAG
jgi:thiol-disulfide isomerase/thioredoxin